MPKEELQQVKRHLRTKPAQDIAKAILGEHIEGTPEEIRSAGEAAGAIRDWANGLGRVED